MPYIATNNTKTAVPIRDNDGKRFIDAGASHVVAGRQHYDAIVASGLDVVWTEDRDMEQAEASTPPKTETETEDETEKPKRKATVTVREK